jgi:hypothetical protein
VVLRTIVLRACAAPLLALVFAAGNAAPAAASTPALAWQGTARIGILCQLSSDRPDTLQLEAELCRRVAAAATRRAPMPVAVVQPGDPALIAADQTVLLVQASLLKAAGRPVFAFTIRPHRASLPNEILFGTAPRAVDFTDFRAGVAALGEALEEALAGVLPWGAPKNEAQPIR